CGEMNAAFTTDAFVIQLASRECATPSRLRGATVRLSFEGASSDAVVEGVDVLPGDLNYFCGRDPSRWRTHVPAYASLRYRNLYPGTDIVVREQSGHVEYALLLAPSADVTRIVVRCEGAESLAIDPDGSLAIITSAGRLEEARPITYQVAADGSR